MTKLDEEREERIAKLEAEVAALRKAAEPPKPFVSPGPRQAFDPTSAMGLPASAVRAMTEVVGDGMVRAIAREQSKSPALPSPRPVLRSAGCPSAPVVRGSGWREPAPLSSPPGQDHIARLVDEADRRDKIDLARRLARGEG
jgi:hypothetical protein